MAENSATVGPTDGMVIRTDTTLAPGTYFLPAGLTIAADGVTLDGNGATLIGADGRDVGVRIEGRKGVTVRNLRLREYYHGIVARDAERLLLERNSISATAEVEPNTAFLDVWKDATTPYGGAILLERAADANIVENDLRHQMNGLLTYHCRRLSVRRNNASYNSGFGIHLFDTSDSVFEENWADFCCRYEPRDRPAPRVGAGGIGHMGADATGFLIVYNSCRNVFRRNSARMGGDGFFLAGRNPAGEDVPCNDNLFEENDATGSPNIAFEGTFSSGNVYRGNWADRCNYGFWLGFSKGCRLEGNRSVHNRQAGIAVENGVEFTVRGNDFQHNHIAGVLLWSHYVREWFDDLPDRRAPHHWLIEGCKFTRNGVGIAIRADQDHGVRPAPGAAPDKPTRPHDHVIRGNDIQDNRVGIHLLSTERVQIDGNTISRNVEADIRREDDHDTTVGSNLGLRGGYL